MQFISFFTTLATFKVASAAALPSAVKGANDLVTRDGSIFGTKVCVDVNFGGYCQTFSSAESGLTHGSCVRLDDSIRGLVSSVQPIGIKKSFCRYWMTENCLDPNHDGWSCAYYDAINPIADLKTEVPPATFYGIKCEPGNMDKKIRSFACYPMNVQGQ